MKKFKYVLPILAVVLAVVAVFAFKPKPVKVDKPLVTETWIKYDCATGTEENPVPVFQNGGLLDITEGMANTLCEGGSTVICAVKLPVTQTSPGSPQEPLIFNESTQHYEFNPLYTDPIDYSLYEKRFCDQQ